MTRFIRLPQVMATVGFSAMTIWRREKVGTFPRRVKLGPNSVAWIEEEIAAWCDARVAERHLPTDKLPAVPQEGEGSSSWRA